ncbi:MAG: TrkH family potassium uptake protein [Bacillota bacterium]
MLGLTGNDENTRILKHGQKRTKSLTTFQILALGLSSIILVGTLLLLIPGSTAPGYSTDFLTALFTATSATCLTGLVVVDTGTHWSIWGQAIILFLIQLGGLGFMTVFSLIAIMLGRTIGLRERLVIQQSLNQVTIEGIIRLVRYVAAFSFAIEGTFAIVLIAKFLPDMPMGQAVWFGVFHAVSAFNNAGFDLFGNFASMTAFHSDPVITLSITTMVILGGLGFTVLADIHQQRNFRKLSLHSKLVLTVTGVLVATGTLIIFIMEYNNALRELSPMGKILASYFQAVTPRSSGFVTISMNELGLSTQFFMIILMFIGAGPGSTGGGIKVTTFAVMILMVLALAKNKEDVTVYNRRLPREQINKSLAITLLAFAWITILTMILTITENADFMTILFEAVSASAIVGLSLGLTPELSDPGKVLVTISMFAGRIGPLTLAFALAQKVKRKQGIRYPEEPLLIG